MAYVPGFSYDVFISYAREDNQDGWVGRFQEAIKGELNRRLGVRVSIFFDEAAGGSLAPSAVDAKATLGQSAILVPLLSPQYADSEWCALELRAFASEIASQGNFFERRILPIQVRPVKRQQVDDMLRRLQWFVFPSKSGEASDPVEAPESVRAVHQFAAQIADALSEMRRASVGQPDVESPPSEAPEPIITVPAYKAAFAEPGAPEPAVPQAPEPAPKTAIWHGQVFAGYRADDPNTGADLLGITKEAEALASVLAAKTIDPPLSLGLFGEWGSGKSFFMRLISQRVTVLQNDARKAREEHVESVYCEDIVQLNFNAWSYIDSNLWASLTAKIFEELAAELARKRLGEDNQPNPEALIAERERVLAAVSSSQDVLAAAEQRRLAAESDLQRVQTELDRLKGDVSDIEFRLQPAELFRHALASALTDSKIHKDLEQAADELHLPDDQAAAAEIKKEILDLRGGVGAIVFAICKNKGWMIASFAALIIAIAACKAAALIHSLAPVATVISGFVVAVAAMLEKPARISLAFVKSKQKLIKKKKADRKQELEEKRTRIENRLNAAQRERDAAEQAVNALNEQLERMRADRQMADYIRQRNESSDYTQHLGLIARVRSDFEHLSILLRGVREQSHEEIWKRFDEKNQERKLFPRIQRIILYIDDLDRCPEKTVFEVLQAVHLLLAFPLFVVVVGVDPRWLLRSLEQHAGALQASANGDLAPDPQWQSTPLNYLEKIFQIPFTLRPIDEAGFARMVDDLSSNAQGDSRPAPAPPPTVPVANEPQYLSADVFEKTEIPVPEPEPAQAAETAAPITPTIDRNPSHLRIEPEEREFMKLLHPFMPSPRAGKRFVNIYRLLRASVEHNERARFVGNGKSGEFQVALLLLAIVTGFPNQATDLFETLVKDEPQTSWWDFLASMKTRYASAATSDSSNENWTALFTNLDRLRPNLEDRSCEVFGLWATRVARYSFQSGRLVLMHN